MNSSNASMCAAGEYFRSTSFGDDIVIVAAYRAALCKARRGQFKDTLPDDLLAPVLKAVVETARLNPAEVGDIVVGTVLPPGSQRASECRMAAFYAEFPEIVPIRTVNRQCSSGLQAVADVAAFIRADFYDIGIGAGVESMSVNPMSWEGSPNPKEKNFQQALDCLLPMGITSENVAERYGVTRKEQDQAAVDSHRKAAAATASGRFKDEIVLVATKIVDPKTGDEKHITVTVDDGIRASTTLADLAKLRPAFKRDGSTTVFQFGNGLLLLKGYSHAEEQGKVPRLLLDQTDLFWHELRISFENMHVPDYVIFAHKMQPKLFNDLFGVYSKIRGPTCFGSNEVVCVDELSWMIVWSEVFVYLVE
ncbi:acetyl-CoA C-acyltransferase [Ranunculus cassubicifolius]